MSRHSITTFKGTEFDPFRPINIKEDIKVIAKGLSKTGRFSGQGVELYSVAEHSVLLSRIMRYEKLSNELALVALMHDSPDFLLGDIATPIRQHLKMIHYNALYESMLYNFIEATGIKDITSKLDLIDEYDKRLALTEAAAIGIDASKWTDPR